MSIESDYIKFNQLNDLLDDRLSRKDMHALIDQMLENKHSDPVNENNQLKDKFKQLTAVRHVISSVAKKSKMPSELKFPIDISQLVSKKISEQELNKIVVLNQGTPVNPQQTKGNKSYSFFNRHKLPLAIAASILLLLFNLPFLQHSSDPSVRSQLQVVKVKQNLPAVINSHKVIYELNQNSALPQENDNKRQIESLLQNQQLVTSERANTGNSLLLQYLEQQKLKRQQFDNINFYNKVAVSPYGDLFQKVNLNKD